MTPAATFALLVYSIVCAIAGALIGERKGHKVQGMFAGLLLGLIGILAVSLWRVDKSRRPAA